MARWSFPISKTWDLQCFLQVLFNLRKYVFSRRRLKKPNRMFRSLIVSIVTRSVLKIYLHDALEFFTFFQFYLITISITIVWLCNFNMHVKRHFPIACWNILFEVKINWIKTGIWFRNSKILDIWFRLINKLFEQTKKYLDLYLCQLSRYFLQI